MFIRVKLTEEMRTDGRHFPRCCTVKKDKLCPPAGDASTRRISRATWKLSVSHTYFFPAAVLISDS